MIRFDHVTKSYKGTPRPALDDITTEILRGEFVFVVGASGSGKSTFLRLILREERATRGKLHVLGQDLSSISNRKVPYFRRNVGVVFQDFRLLTNKTVFDNVAFTLQVIGKSKGFIHEAVPDVLAMVGLEGKGQRFPHELSGGEQQRVAIARAVVNKPQILLADEPTGNLDPATSAGITAVLERINASGTTVLMATHEAGLVDRMQKRVIEIVSGRLVRDERHGGYGVTAAIPVVGEREQVIAGSARYEALTSADTAQQPAAASVAQPVQVARTGKPTRAERKAEKRAHKDVLRAPYSAPAPSQPASQTAMQAAPVQSPAVQPSAVQQPAVQQPAQPFAGSATGSGPAHRGGPADVPVSTGRLPVVPDEPQTAAGQQQPPVAQPPATEIPSTPPPPSQPLRPRTDREPVAASAPRAASPRSDSVLDGHFANPPTAPVRRADSSDVAELTLAERLGLRAPGRHDPEDDSNQDVGPVS
ncbi:cell division ATP-binding protein FtsE [Rathayibacter sp. KR2-224]|uniref:cell division ATP-binding protein FtsE n=1 Tax=Rathayibacter sp. KR2-224 TaxID=3400913 RepID=UPI003BFD2D08